MMHEFKGGEFIIMGVPGETVDPQTQAIITEVQPSGFILFARNIKTPEQLRNLTDKLRSLVSHEPIITIDQEGGRVSRLKEFMTEPPSARQLAARGDKSLIETHGRLTGQLLRLFGFNLNLAPVLDIEIDERNENSLKGRTYGRSAPQVIENAHAFASNMAKAGILTCGKHFPGYSHAVVDPHNALPSINRTFDEMTALEWVPFARSASMVDFMMIGHVLYPQIDSSGLPASLSPYMVRTVLREKLGFGGCVITDDMDMGAIKSSYGSAEAAKLALEAGNDFVLVCHNIPGVPEIAASLRKVARPAQEQSYERILNVRKRLSKPEQFSERRLKELDEQVNQLRTTILKEPAFTEAH
jgi:beta-N-acetylhexosaminidase